MHTEHEITPKANLYIWGYFFLFVILLYLIITGLTIYFKDEVEQESYVKVGSVKSPELIEHRHLEQEELKGIEDAMEKVVRAAN
ncbi:MAG: hypothetical protein WCK42_02330 [Myxococcaceae bacterium]